MARHGRGPGDGVGDPRQFYVVWWVVGMLPAVYELFTHLDRGRVVSVAPAAQAAPTTAYLVLPFVSLLAHMGILHWVYRVDYYGAHAAPLLLGLTLVLNRYSADARCSRARTCVTLRLLLPAMAAVLVSVTNPFVFDAGIAYPRLDAHDVQPALAGAFLVYVYCFLLPYARLVLVAGAAAAAVYVLGPTWQQVDRAVQQSWARGTGAGRTARPQDARRLGRDRPRRVVRVPRPRLLDQPAEAAGRCTATKTTSPHPRRPSRREPAS